MTFRVRMHIVQQVLNIPFNGVWSLVAHETLIEWAIRCVFVGVFSALTSEIVGYFFPSFLKPRTDA